MEGRFKDLSNKDVPIEHQGKVMVEIGELAGMSTMLAEEIKLFLSKCDDRFREPYARKATPHPRMRVFIGTCNKGSYLSDSSGGRRFWPMKVHAPVDKVALAIDLRQIWAEAAYLEAEGVSDVLSPELWPAAARRVAAETVQDDVTVRIDELLGVQEELLRLEAHVEATDVLIEFQEDEAKLGEVVRLYRERVGDDFQMEDHEVDHALRTGPIVRFGGELRLGSTRLAKLLDLKTRSPAAFANIRDHMERRGWTYSDMVRTPLPGAGYRKPI